MNSPIQMPDLGENIYLKFTLGDCAKLNFEFGSFSGHLELIDPVFITRALFHGLKRVDGVHINRISPYGPLNLDDIPVPLSTLTARIQQALQQATTG